MARKPVKYSVVDAFTELPFKGNPAAVCLLEEEREDDWLQSVASEFNLSETCYLTRIDLESARGSPNAALHPRFRLRWFTPVTEVELCGHATLAAAHTLFTSGLLKCNTIEFLTQSGILTAKKVPDLKKSEPLKYENGEANERFFIELDFPATTIAEDDSVEVSSLHKALSGASALDIKKTTGHDFLVELSSVKMIADFKPQFDEIQKCPGRGLIITAAAPEGSEFDFVSRFFCPKFGINEDPVCGSAHCALAPYWCKKLGKCDLVAYQASPRGGVLHLHVEEKHQRILIRGKAVTVMEGSLLV